jgi:UDP-glucose 4-epimerase
LTNNKVLITGGAGFIGSHLSAALLRKGYVITVFDNLSSGKLENLKEIIEDPNVTFIKGDIRDQNALEEAFEEVNCVIHLAALVDVTASVNDPISTNEINVSSMLNVLRKAVHKKIRRLVFSSSAAVYGDAKTLPITEQAPAEPISSYAASKLAGEAYCKAFENSYGLSSVVLRFFNVFGPRTPSNAYSGVITKFLQNSKKNEALTIYGDGEQTRDFVYIDDIVNALILALENKKASGKVFNICTGRPSTITGLAKAVQETMKTKSQIIYAPERKGEIKCSYGDPSEAKRELGFTAKTTLKEGLISLLSEN